LFEEANIMVSDEKRKLYGSELLEAELRRELKEVKEAWQTDLNQLNELRDKLRHGSYHFRRLIVNKGHSEQMGQPNQKVMRTSQTFTLIQLPFRGLNYSSTRSMTFRCIVSIHIPS